MLSKLYGYIVDSYGNVIPGKNGQRQPVAKTKPKSTAPSPTQARLKRNQAVANVNKLLFNPKTQDQRQLVTDAETWNEIVPKINSAISNAGIDPQSPAGIELRKNAFRLLNVATGPKGNPIGDLRDQ